jgi:hypothetical protein
LEAIHFLPGTGRTTLIAASGAPINENRPKFDLGGVSETRAIQRVCLQDGLKLDLNWLIRQGAARPGTRSGPYLIQWTNNYTGEVVRVGRNHLRFCSQEEGWFRFEAGKTSRRSGPPMRRLDRIKFSLTLAGLLQRIF